MCYTKYTNPLNAHPNSISKVSFGVVVFALYAHPSSISKFRSIWRFAYILTKIQSLCLLPSVWSFALSCMHTNVRSVVFFLGVFSPSIFSQASKPYAYKVGWGTVYIYFYLIIDCYYYYCYLFIYLFTSGLWKVVLSDCL